jgi:hypothetical protein
VMTTIVGFSITGSGISRPEGSLSRLGWSRQPHTLGEVTCSAKSDCYDRRGSIA